MIHIGSKTYELVQEHKNGYNFEAFRDRFSEVLERYDYIVGDWGYSQLRLKGFFKESNKHGNKDTCASGIQDYLNEYCNFGCAYFILRKVNTGKPQPEPAVQPNAGEGLNPPQPAASKPTGPAYAEQRHHPRHEHPRHERHERGERQGRHERHDRQDRHERQERPQHQPQK
ncbi:YutD family protein [Paenibacillus sp. GYB003]|uniref:YutD family protein n=1 Tax=Paenibacillus sp. GYB003 TaxID=2994392 RepID=UPI002F965A94